MDEPKTRDNVNVTFLPGDLFRCRATLCLLDTKERFTNFITNESMVGIVVASTPVKSLWFQAENSELKLVIIQGVTGYIFAGNLVKL